jgi:hypothetical protein
MPRGAGNDFAWGSIGNWAGPLAADTFQITEWNTLRDDIAATLAQSFRHDGSGTMTGQFKALAGSAANPGITFATDTNTGLYSIAGDQLGISAGGTLVATATTSGVEFPQAVTSSNVNLAISGVGGLTWTAVSFTTAGSYAKVTGSGISGNPYQVNEDYGNNLLRVLKPATYNVQVTGVVTKTTTGRVDLRVYKNGTSIVPIVNQMYANIATTGDYSAFCASGIIAMATNDYFELFANISSGAGTATITGSMFAYRSAL